MYAESGSTVAAWSALAQNGLGHCGTGHTDEEAREGKYAYDADDQVVDPVWNACRCQPILSPSAVSFELWYP